MHVLMNNIKPPFHQRGQLGDGCCYYVYYNNNVAPGACFNSSLFKIGGYRRSSVSLDNLFLTNINFKSLIPAPGYQYPAPAILSQKIPAV